MSAGRSPAAWSTPASASAPALSTFGPVRIEAFATTRVPSSMTTDFVVPAPMSMPAVSARLLTSPRLRDRRLDLPFAGRDVLRPLNREEGGPERAHVLGHGRDVDLALEPLLEGGDHPQVPRDPARERDLRFDSDPPQEGDGPPRDRVVDPTQDVLDLLALCEMGHDLRLHEHSAPV